MTRSPKAPNALQALLNGRPSDLEAWAAVLAPDAHLRIANAAPAVGREEALRDLAVLLAGIEGMGHAFADSVQVGNLVLVETDILCRAGGASVPAVIPCAVLARVGGGLLKDVRFYLDPSPLGLGCRHRTDAGFTPSGTDWERRRRGASHLATSPSQATA